MATACDTIETHHPGRSREATDDLVCPCLYWDDPVFRRLLGRWQLGERGVALLTAVLGFGVLTTWYLVGCMANPATRGLRGPFDYYSATLGDLLLIPLLNGVAVRYVRRIVGGLSRAVAAAWRRTWRPLAIVGRAYQAPLGRTFAMAVMGVAVTLEHLSELYGPDRNWTVPHWGQPSPAAIYHQLFFACEALIVGFLVVRHVVTTKLLLRLAAIGSSRPRLRVVAEQSQRLYGWALLGWGGFVSLRVMDFFYLTPTVSMHAMAALPAPVVVLAVYYVALVGTGVVPMFAVTRRYELGWMRFHWLLISASFVAPLVGPAARIIAARFVFV